MKEDEYLMIEDTTGSGDVFDVEYLKDEAVEDLQRLTGKEWTDFNIHDPGITTLEVLCFALTELAYRADYKVEDIFLDREKDNGLESSFFSAQEILTSGNVTLEDLKKLILDITGIKNVELIPAEEVYEFNGLFDVYVELYDIKVSEEKRTAIRKELSQLLINNRVLCTGVSQIIFFESDPIAVDLSIELSGKVNPSDFLRSVASAIENYFSPTPEYQSLEEMLEEGIGVGEIFSGPLLKNGFISEEKIKEFKTRSKILVSDLVNAIMEIEKVVHISKLDLRDSDEQSYNWIYDVKKGLVPRLNLAESKLAVTYKGKESFALSFSTLFSENFGEASGSSSSHKKNTLVEPKGSKKDFLNFRSIQHDFPKLYGVGGDGLPVGSDVSTEAYARQFKGYLNLFDQIFANYFAQLDYAKHLFSLNNIQTTTAVQVLEESPGIYWIYKPFMDAYLAKHHEVKEERHVKKEWRNYLQEHKESIEINISETVEDRRKFLERRNAVLDHLLARFGYDLTSFEFVAQLSASELIDHKINLLRNLTAIGSERLKGIRESYLGFGILEDRSGFEKYLYTVLGLRAINSSKLTDAARNVFNSNSKKKNVQFVFTNENRSDVLAKTLALGSVRHNYSLEGGFLKLYEQNGDLFARTKNKIKQDEEIFISKLFSKIADLNSASEGFYLIEHLLLKPTDSFEVFGFSTLLKDEVIFESQFNFTRDQRDQLVESFKSGAVDIEKYTIKEVGLKQYKIYWLDGQNELVSRHFFESEEAAESATQTYIQYFDDQQDVSNIVERSTKYRDFYNEIKDPFSNILSYVLPIWPSRFQNNAFKKYIEDFILAETPAHIFANIIWLDFEEMLDFENRFEKWLVIPESDSTEKLLALEEFLPALVKSQ